MAGIDWDRLWEHVTSEFACGRDSIHGPSHWRRVEENGLRITNRDDLCRLRGNPIMPVLA